MSIERYLDKESPAKRNLNIVDYFAKNINNRGILA